MVAQVSDSPYVSPCFHTSALSYTCDAFSVFALAFPTSFVFPSICPPFVYSMNIRYAGSGIQYFAWSVEADRGRAKVGRGCLLGGGGEPRERRTTAGPNVESQVPLDQGALVSANGRVETELKTGSVA